jgi:hypothetical protein
MQRRILAVGMGVVLVCVLASPALACNYDSWLVADAPSGDGTVIVRGGGFAAGPVLFTWDRSDGAVAAEAEADEEGNVVVNLQLPDRTTDSRKVIALTTVEGSPASPATWAYVPVTPPIVAATGDGTSAGTRDRGPVVVGTAGAGILLVMAGLLIHRRRRPAHMTTADLLVTAAELRPGRDSPPAVRLTRLPASGSYPRRRRHQRHNACWSQSPWDRPYPPASFARIQALARTGRCCYRLEVGAQERLRSRADR